MEQRILDKNTLVNLKPHIHSLTLSFSGSRLHQQSIEIPSASYRLLPLSPSRSLPSIVSICKSRTEKEETEFKAVVVLDEESKETVRTDAVVVKKEVNRCSGCRKRVGLIGFRCRCGDLFCAEHRYSDCHDCSYDYKTAGREAIVRDNSVVKAAKIVRI